MDWPTIVAIGTLVVGGNGLLAYFAERRTRNAIVKRDEAEADSSSVQASERAVLLAMKMMERMEAELLSSKKIQALLIDYVKDLRGDLVRAGIPATPVPKDLRETVI